MSGGTFDYKQYQISQIVEDIEQILIDNGRKKTQQELKEESWHDVEWYEKYPEDLYHYKYPDDIIEEFKKGLRYLNLAAIYTQRIDWLLAGDDGEDSFRERLKKELDKFERDEESK
jgi:hypothetical protein